MNEPSAILEHSRLILSLDFKVSSAETDMEARLRPGALVNLLIQAAIASADDLGFGFDNLHKEQLIWVLSRMQIEIRRPMKWYETGTVLTWPKDIDGLLYLRDFEVLDRDRQLVAVATSGWLAIDTVSRRPRQIHASFLNVLKMKHGIEARPEKLPQVQQDATALVTPTYFDFDLNRHVTSTRYVDWMFDQLPPEYLHGHYPKALILNYLKETMPGEPLAFRLQRENSIFRIEGVHTSTQLSSFRGKIEF